MPMPIKTSRPHIFRYSPTKMADPKSRTFFPRFDERDLLNDINRDHALVSINGVTIAELRMQDNQFSKEQKELYSLGSTAIFQETNIKKLQTMLAALNKDNPTYKAPTSDREVKLALIDILDKQLIPAINFKTTAEYKDFLKKHLLSNVKDKDKQEFLAETLLRNSHQSGFYKAADYHFSAKYMSLSYTHGEVRGCSFRSDIGEEKSSVLSPNEVCVERYEKNILYYRARNELGEETTGTIEVGDEPGKLSKKQFKFLTDPERKFKSNSNTPKIAYLNEERTSAGRSALQAIFDITSERGHIQSKKSKELMNAELEEVKLTGAERPFVATRPTGKGRANLTCNNDTVHIGESIIYDEFYKGNKMISENGHLTTALGAPEKLETGFAKVDSTISISATSLDITQGQTPQFELEFKHSQLDMEITSDIPSYAKEYFKEAFSSNDQVLREVSDILSTPLPSATDRVKLALFNALHEVGRYQQGALSANELVKNLEAKKAEIQANERRPSFVRRHSLIGRKETASDCINKAIEKAKNLPDYIPNKEDNKKESTAAANTEKTEQRRGSSIRIFFTR